MNLMQFDLNLLKAFDILMLERNVTRAARRLSVSQSALSHTLKRLRNAFDDPLLISTAQGMVPTPRALELEAPLRQILLQIERQIAAPDSFDPAVSQQCFRIGATDYVEYVILPPLLKFLATHAPNLEIRLQRFDVADTESLLEEQKLDLVIAFQGDIDLPERIQHETLYEEAPVCLVRTEHPDVDQHLTIDQYAELMHLAVDSLDKLTQAVDNHLYTSGRRRRIKLRTPNFLSAPMILAETDMIATLPYGIASRFIAGKRLKLVPIPFDLGDYQVNMYWHKLLTKDPAQHWLRDQIQAVANRIVAA